MDRLLNEMRDRAFTAGLEAAQKIEEKQFDPAGGVYVTVAGDNSLGITANNRLVYFYSNTRRSSQVKDLGPATRQNIQSLRYALERLAIHSSEE